MDNGDTPAWLLCEDILTKTKDEMILEAIDILHEQIDAKRIDIQGYVPVLMDRSEELQKDMFIINNMLANREQIRGQYSSYINKETKDPALLSRIEELKRLVMAVDAIEFLMGMSHVFESWAEETGRYGTLKDPAELLRRSMSNSQRKEALEYVLSSKKFKDNDALSEKELSLLKDVLNGKKQAS
ncbi:MAG: hypothetical protein KGH69_03620 [Candidatus Micrarchaeota archaeon]|nr:hypothetical protein [Candidatus Micrarchaeota archaeon]